MRWNLARWTITTLAILSIWPYPANAAPAQILDVAGIKATVWMPAETNAKGAPVIVFSHGFHGCAAQASFLMEALSDAGYAVFAVDHADAACRNPLRWLGSADVPFRFPDRWEQSTYAARAKDLEHLIEAAARDPRF